MDFTKGIGAMLIWFCNLVLTIWFAAVELQKILTQPTSEIKLPGETLTLTCNGISSFLSSWIQWTYKIGDEGIKWIGESNPDGSRSSVRQSLRDRFAISRDNSRDIASLEIRHLKVGDSGLYYCSAHSEIEQHTNCCVSKCHSDLFCLAQIVLNSNGC